MSSITFLPKNLQVGTSFLYICTKICYDDAQKDKRISF